MAKVFLICGKICSGKGFYTRQLKEKEHAVVLSCDEIENDLFHHDLDDRRDAAALGDVESGAPGHGREADGAAQAGRGVERDRRASCETSCADQVCTSGVGDAQVDRPRRRGRDRVAKLSAERGVLLRNLCECHWIVF